jgi:hypothetical protein
MKHMSRLLAVFNLLAGATSFIGLYLTLFTKHDLSDLWPLYAITATLVVYVLFFPGNPLEKNALAKFSLYQVSPSENGVVILEDDFSLEGGKSKSIRFPCNFAEIPTVELIRLDGDEEVMPVIKVVTQHHFELHQPYSTYSWKKAKFQWVVKGIPLVKTSKMAG